MGVANSAVWILWINLSRVSINDNIGILLPRETDRTLGPGRSQRPKQSASDEDQQRWSASGVPSATESPKPACDRSHLFAPAADGPGRAFIMVRGESQPLDKFLPMLINLNG
jgi:hypothetical protein